MKVLIGMPPAPAGTSFERPFMVPLAIYALTAILREKGHEVVLLDPCTQKDRLVDPEALAHLAADVGLVGLSCNSFNWATALFLLKGLEERIPNVPTLIGGVHATHRGRWIMEHSPATYVIAGEGEVALPVLVGALEGKHSLTEVPNLYCRDDGGNVLYNGQGQLIDMEEYDFPLPAYELVPDGVYEYMTYETSRGCHGVCTFCSIPFHRCWRGKKPERVVEDLRQLSRIASHKANTRLLYFTDDCFTADRARARQIADEIAAAKLPFSLAIEARANDLFYPGLLDSLKPATEFIQVGVECGYDEGLRRIRKGITVARTREVAAELKRAGLIKVVMFSFIVGLPWEGVKECLQTVRFAAELVANYGGRANIAWWFPVPSRIWDEREQFGISEDETFFDRGDWFSSSNFQLTHPHVTPEEIHRVNTMIATYNASGIHVKD